MRAVVAKAHTNAAPNYPKAEFPMNTNNLIGIREGIHQNYISLSALCTNFYTGLHFEVPERFSFPRGRFVFRGNNRTDKSHRITNRDTFLTELRPRVYNALTPTIPHRYAIIGEIRK